MKPCKSLLLPALALALLMAGSAYGAEGAQAGYDQGVQLGAQGKFLEARAVFEQSLKSAPGGAARNCLGVLDDIQARRIKEQTGIHLFRAFAYFNGFKTDAAIQELNRAAALDPGYPLIYSHRGDAWADQGDLHKAIADYTRALEIDPSYAAGYLHRGNAFASQSQFDKAIADYSRALDLNPRYHQALYSRGNAYAETGRYDQALADYDKLLALDPGYGHAYVRKALACEKAGRPQDALAAYRAYLKNAVTPDPRQVQFVKEKIQTLEKKP